MVAMQTTPTNSVACFDALPVAIPLGVALWLCVWLWPVACVSVLLCLAGVVVWRTI